MTMNKHYIMKVDWEGKQDKHVDDLPSGQLIDDYMKKKGFNQVKNSTTLFKKGKTILYVAYGDIKNPEKLRPKIQDYYDTFKL